MLAYAIIVTTRYVFWAVGMAKNAFIAVALPRTLLGKLTLLPQTSQLLFVAMLNIPALRQGPRKILLKSWKVLEFFVT